MPLTNTPAVRLALARAVLDLLEPLVPRESVTVRVEAHPTSPRAVIAHVTMPRSIAERAGLLED
jgi:hypothetical protein